MKKYIYIVIVLLVLSGAWYFLPGNDKQDENVIDKELEDILNATSTSSINDKPVIKIEPIEDDVAPVYSGQAIDEKGSDPILNAVNKETYDSYVNELSRLKDVLENDPLAVESWVRLGQIKKVFNNYTGARDAWEYVSSIIEPDALLSFNLANLYGFDLKDSKRAVEYYERALELDSDNYDYVIGTIDYYRTMDDKRNRINELIGVALSINPGDSSLLSYIGRYYQDIKNYDKAVEYYEKALQLDPNNEFLKSDLDKVRNM